MLTLTTVRMQSPQISLAKSEIFYCEKSTYIFLVDFDMLQKQAFQKNSSRRYCYSNKPNKPSNHTNPVL